MTPKYIIPALSLAAAMAVASTSCSDIGDDYSSIVPAQYNNSITIKESGLIEVPMSVADGQYCYEVPLLKNGVAIQSEAEIVLDVMNQEWIDENYNNAQGTHYRVIPATMYTIHDYHITIRPGQSGCSARVTFDAPRIFNEMQKPENDGYDMVVPLRIVSANETVNSARSLAILHAVVSPVVVSLQDERQKIKINDDGSATTATFVIEKRGEYTSKVHFDVMSADYLEQNYSIPEDINYRILSPSTYQMEADVEIPAEATFLNHPVTFDAAAISSLIEANPDYTFVLPLIMTSATEGTVTDRSEILLICNSHEYTFIDVTDRTGWKVAYGTIAMPYGRYDFIFDGVEDGEGWMSYINDNFPNSQNLGRPYVVVDMGNRSMVGEIGVKLGHNNGYHDVIPYGIDFYITTATDLDPKLTYTEEGLLNSRGNWGNDVSVSDEYIALDTRLREFDATVDWVKVGSITGLRNEPSACGTYWITVPPAVLNRAIMSRYIKVVLIPQLPSSEAGNRSKIHELYMRRVGTIDGNPVY